MGTKIDLTGTKFLIAAGALAGTIAGWILLSLTGGANAQGGSVLDPAVVDLVNRPLPTLAQPYAKSSGSSVDLNGSAIIQPTAQPTLRSVADQPAPPPAAITQSSK